MRLIRRINASKFVKHFTKFLAKDSSYLVNTPDDEKSTYVVERDRVGTLSLGSCRWGRVGMNMATVKHPLTGSHGTGRTFPLLPAEPGKSFRSIQTTAQLRLKETH